MECVKCHRTGFTPAELKRHQADAKWCVPLTGRALKDHWAFDGEKLRDGVVKFECGATPPTGDELLASLQAQIAELRSQLEASLATRPDGSKVEVSGLTSPGPTPDPDTAAAMAALSTGVPPASPTGGGE